MILCREEILEALARGDLAIDPYDPSYLGAASIDLRLARYFRRLLRSRLPLDILAEVDYRDPSISELVELLEGQTIDLPPGETILGITIEKVRLGERLCGRLEGRSRFARLGLLIHISAGFMAPGTDNQQVLEISNMSSRTLRLHPGAAVAQAIFERMGGPAQHSDRYRRQSIEDFMAPGAF